MQALLYQGRVFWIWGDTPWLAHPLGNFHTSGATSLLPSQGGLDPALGVDLDYFVGPDGNARAMAAIPGPGATWLTALVNVPDARGEETLFALYGKHKRVEKPEEHGLARFDRERSSSSCASGCSTTPCPCSRADRRCWCAARTAPSSTTRTTSGFRREPRASPTRRAGSPSRPSRRGASGPSEDARGEVRYAWRRGVPGASEADLRARRLAPEETLFGHVRDIESGKPVVVHATSTAENPVSRPLRPHLHRAGRLALTARRDLVHRSRHADGALVLRAQDREPPQLQLLQPVPPRLLRPARRAHALLRGDLHGGLRGGSGADTALRLQPDHAPPGSRRSRACGCRSRSTTSARAGRAERFVDRRALRREDGDPLVAFFAYDRPAPGTVPVWWSGRRLRRAPPAGGRHPGHRAALPCLHSIGSAHGAAHAPRSSWIRPALAKAHRGEPLAFVLESPLRVRLPVSELPRRDERGRRPRPLPARGARGRGRLRGARGRRLARLQRGRLDLSVVLAGRLGDRTASRGAPAGRAARRAARSHDSRRCHGQRRRRDRGGSRSLTLAGL